jgi:hypothetical protein
MNSVLNPVPIRFDVEGELVRASDQHPHYVKRLSTGTYWHVFEPLTLVEALGCWPDSPLVAVTISSDPTTYDLHYRADVEPLDLERLRELVRPDALLGPWRLIRLAIDLTDQLRELHNADVPQMVIHPERVGRSRGRYVLLPTMAGFLPPLGQMPENHLGGWLHFVAPEVLRHRAMERELLFAGDIFSLGRMLGVISIPSWDPPAYIDHFMLAERRVESVEPDATAPAATGLEAFQGLCQRMAAFCLTERPTLEQIISELKALVVPCAPDVVLTDIYRSRSVSLAQRFVREIEEMDRSKFGHDPALIHIARADLALLQTPPDAVSALEELSRARPSTGYQVQVQQRIARAHALNTANPQFVRLSSEAYQTAALLSNYAPEILDEWVTNLLVQCKPEVALEETQLVPLNQRSRRMIVLRGEAQLALERPLDAWYEVALSFPRFEFDAVLYDLCLRIGQACADPTELVRWLHQNAGKAGFDAPRAVVWICNKNPVEAQKCLTQARLYRP